MLLLMLKILGGKEKIERNKHIDICEYNVSKVELTRNTMYKIQWCIYCSVNFRLGPVLDYETSHQTHNGEIT